MSALQLAHRHRVMRLYRQGLRTAFDWFWSRDVWYKQARLLRQRFEENKGLTDVKKIELVVAAGEEELNSKRHPDPYKRPYVYGGSKYGRNAGMPTHIKYHMDFQREKPYWH